MSKPNVCDDCGEALRLVGPIGSVTLRCGCKADTDFAALLETVRDAIKLRTPGVDTYVLDRIARGDLSAEQCAELARAARGGGK